MCGETGREWESGRGGLCAIVAVWDEVMKRDEWDEKCNNCVASCPVCGRVVLYSY